MDNKLITKVTRFFERGDGSVVRIVAYRTGYASGLQTDYYVHVKKDPFSEWRLCSDRPLPGWKTMPLSDYEKFGRAEVFRVLTHGEIFGTLEAIGKPLIYIKKWER